MLTSLHIRNFAIVDALDLEFGAGLTVLTGETGAGKSILVDALALALGQRANNAKPSDGGQRTEVSACFELHSVPEARGWLAERALDPPEECVIRRVIGTDGRSRAFINGSPVALQDLRALGELLVDIHGQHAHHALLRPDVQRALLDDFGDHRDLMARVREAHQEWRRLERELADTGGDPARRHAEIELLRFHIGELTDLAVTPGEVAGLDQEHRRLANAERLRDGAGAVYEALYGDHDGAALQALQAAVKQLEALTASDTTLGPVGTQLNEAAIQLAECDRELRQYIEAVALDPQRLATVEQRLDALHQAARKHQVTPDELPALLDGLTARLARLEESGERRSELATRLDRVREDYDGHARRLTQARTQAARRLAEAVTADLHRLGIAKGALEVTVAPLPDHQASAHGRDRVEFLVTTNPGRPAGPLNRVASGGELSRISLAIQVVGSRDHGISTLIFDEVDVGIGGAVAEMVGNQLRTLAANRQVLCVTHLPQVAAQGHQHLRVVKAADNGATTTRVDPLEGTHRVEEVARMLGGLEITRHTRAHAKEMIQRIGGP
ncbi:MAG: DNA repair protein RecN [Gammaproteobacteria bacterium]|nr:DNA repair protein RecN [Gammaproteobacteria bacterium]